MEQYAQIHEQIYRIMEREAQHRASMILLESWFIPEFAIANNEAEIYNLKALHKEAMIARERKLDQLKISE